MSSNYDYNHNSYKIKFGLALRTSLIRVYMLTDRVGLNWVLSVTWLKQKFVTLRPATPWFSGEINNLKKHRRKLQRRWRRTKLPMDRQLFIDQCRAVNNLICFSKNSYYTSLINDNKSDHKLRFQTINIYIISSLQLSIGARKYVCSILFG